MGSRFQTVFFIVAIVISILNIWDRYFSDRVKRIIQFPKTYKFSFRQQSATRSATCLRWNSRCTSHCSLSQDITAPCWGKSSFSFLLTFFIMRVSHFLKRGKSNGSFLKSLRVWRGVYSVPWIALLWEWHRDLYLG